MNTILISGTATSINNKVVYSVHFWGAKKGQPIQFITSDTLLLSGYDGLWNAAKIVASNYFKDSSFSDGAYTQFLDHITITK